MPAVPTGLPPPPPPGGDQNRGPTINLVVWIFTGISLACVTARMYGRVFLTRNVGWDDFWIVLSMILGLFFSICCSIYVHQGGGRHPYYLGISQTSDAIFTITVGNIAGIVSVAVPKLAVAVLLTRLLNPAKSQKMVLYAITVSCVVTQTVCAIIMWRQCSPTAAVWDSRIRFAEGTRCWALTPMVHYYIFAGAYSVFVDWYLAIWPMFVLWKLHISQQRKFMLSGVLGLGIIAGAVGIYKCTTLNQFYHGEDYTYVTTPLEIMTSVEAEVIITAACLPTLRPVFLALKGNLTALSSSRSPNSSADRKTNTYLQNKRSKRAGEKSYQLQEYGSDGKAYSAGSRGTGGRFGVGGGRNKGGGAKDPYDIGTTTVGGDEQDSLKERILTQPASITNTVSDEENQH